MDILLVYRMGDLVEIFKISESTIRRRIRSGEFPEGRKYGGVRLWTGQDIQYMLGKFNSPSLPELQELTSQ